MQRYLNLNDVSGKALAVIGLFFVAVPVLSLLLERLLAALHAAGAWLGTIRFGSLVIGGLLLAGFLVFIVLEQIQDHLLYRQYRASRHRRLNSSECQSECPYCGNRCVQDFERYCSICGQALD